MTIKLAMLGTGSIADNELVPALAQVEEAVLWSVLSRDQDRAKAFAAKHGAASPKPAFADLGRLLADPELDGVIIATPDALHKEQAVAAAEAGKHVLTEKPMATENADARAMIEACERAGVKLGVAYHMRWHDGHRRLEQAVAAGELGELRHMRLQWSWLSRDNSNWRASPEVGRWWGLAGVGTHCLDQARWFMCPGCGEVVELASVISREFFGGPHDESAVLALRFESGATAEICTSVVFNAPRRMEVYGSEGFVICEETLGASGGGRMWSADGDFHFEKRNPYVGEIRDFVAAIEEDREPEVAGPEGARNVELLLEAIS